MDDLFDLDLSATAKPPATNGQGARPNPQAAYGTGRSTFDYLSSMRTTTPSPLPSRSASPFAASTAPAPRPTPSSGRPVPPTKANSGDDAFSSLFGASPSGGGASSSNGGGGSLSMAERLAKENAAKFGGGGLSSGGGGWDALSPNNTGSSSTRSGSPALQVPSRTASVNSTASKPASSDPWDFDLLAPTKKPSAAVASPSADPFDMSFDLPTTSSRSSTPATASSVPPRGSNGRSGLLDDEDDDLLGGFSSRRPPKTSTPAPASSSIDDDFDLLGAFSQPASSAPRAAPSPIPRARTSSPPPHVLGQIVEMGFSIPQAKNALAATTTPAGEWNVEGALEALMDQQGVEDAKARRRDEEAWGSRLANEEEDEDAPRRPRREERQREEAPPAPPATGRRAREAAAKAKAAEEATAQSQVEAQAKELLAQASKIGFSVFKSANAYWETGKATIQKALDENTTGGEGEEGGKGKGKGSRPTNGAGAVPGRPKWWTEDMVADDEEETRVPPSAAKASSSRRAPPPEQQQRQEPPPTLFQDSDNEEDQIESVLPQRPNPSRPSPSSRPPPPSVPVPAAEAPPAEYRSPWRRPKPSATPPPAALAASSAPVSRPTRPSPVSASAPPKPTRAPRPSIPVSASSLQSSTTHKTTGNDLFKLGRFGDAAASYSLAIDALPAGTLALVPLYNNRAAARLKVGDEKGAAEDCTVVVQIILGGGLPEGGARIDLVGLEEEQLPSEAKGINLKEQLGKALGKRAKALEVDEKWKKAYEDWNALMGGGEAFAKSAGGTKLVSEGVARCRKMMGGDGGASKPAAAVAARPRPTTTPASRPKPTPAPAVQASGNAVRALQAASKAADAEDDLRLSLKDSVDAKIVAWKGGKEANLRALIASLDNVLWPELEWKKVGMHELISEGQLKVRYVRAIAKVHPDKLNVSNTTVEQRMIAGLVFAGLNDAWNAQKS